jgi:hypothetical protein
MVTNSASARDVSTQTVSAELMADAPVSANFIVGSTTGSDLAATHSFLALNGDVVKGRRLERFADGGDQFHGGFSSGWIGGTTAAACAP